MRCTIQAPRRPARRCTFRAPFTDFGVNADSDTDGDGDSDGNDFLIWQRNLGSGGKAPLSVPEPAALALILTAALASLGANRQRLPSFSETRIP